jgi:hypothetical protein
MSKNNNSFLRNLNDRFENWPPTAVLMFLAKVIVGLAALIGAVTVIANWLTPNAIVAVNPGWLPCGQPVVLPGAIDPWQDINGAYDRVIKARKNGDFETWQVGPAILQDKSQNFLLTLDLTSRVQGNEWIKLDNTLAVTVERVAEAPEHANQVIATRPCSGGGANHTFPELGIEKDTVLTLASPEASFYYLQPGQLDIFGLPIHCAAPGVYRVRFSMVYTHLETSDEIVFAAPELVCPGSTSQWDVVQEMQFKADYAWNGSAYEPAEDFPTPAVLSPLQALRDYYAALNARQYERAWTYLTRNYTAQAGVSFPQYVEFWDTVDQVNIASMAPIEQRADFATVSLELNLLFRNGQSSSFRQYVKLVYDAGSQSWLLDEAGPNS